MTEKRVFLCGTRTVIERGPSDYRVVCASCGAGGSVKHVVKQSATKACIRDSVQPCRSCGAK